MLKSKNYKSLGFCSKKNSIDDSWLVFNIWSYVSLTLYPLTFRTSFFFTDLHVVLLDDLLVLLQVNDNGKFILKNHNITMVGSTGDNKVCLAHNNFNFLFVWFSPVAYPRIILYTITYTLAWSFLVNQHPFYTILQISWIRQTISYNKQKAEASFLITINKYYSKAVTWCIITNQGQFSFYVHLRDIFL